MLPMPMAPNQMQSPNLQFIKLKSRMNHTTRNLLILPIALFIATGPCVAQTDRPVANPQTQMVGARFAALGGTVPTLKDASGIFLNPASAGQLDANPLSFTNQALLGSNFTYKTFNFCWPFEIMLEINKRPVPQKIQFGLSYGLATSEHIPETVSYNNRFMPVSDYSAGFDIVNATVASEFYELFGVNILSAGANAKIFRQFIAGQSRFAFGFDVGSIATYYFNQYGIEKLHIGASVLNLLSTGMAWPDNKQEAFLPFQIFIGGRADLFDDTLSVFINNDLKGIAVGSEYFIHNAMSIRGSSNFSDTSLGVGLQFENITTGIVDEAYSLRLDYTYTQHSGPLESDPDNTLSLSLLGSSRPKTPRILTPQSEILTQLNKVNLSGIGPKDTSIRIYTNGNLSRTTYSDRYGNWSYPNFPLQEGKNKINITGYSVEKDTSIDSEPVLVVLDTTVPSFNVHIFPTEFNTLKIVVSSNEELAQIDSGLDGTALDFKKTPLLPIWTASIPIPVDLTSEFIPPTVLKSLQLFAVDKAGNQTKVENYPFFFTLAFPTDKFVHYKDSIRLLGQSSALATKIEVGGDPVYVDKDYNFSVSKTLKPGKNLIKLAVKTEGKTLEYKLRILRLITYPDLTRQIKERREIEFLSTLGVIDGDADGNFYPNKDVTRRYIVRTMVKILKLPVEKVSGDLFPDVPKNDPDAQYIQCAIQNGLMFALPDGTFKPDRALTLSEAMFLLSNARIIEEQSVNDDDAYVKRRELAQQLAYSSRYESQIERLIDWEKGYQ